MILPDIGARLLYRDALLLVIDKPAGLPVHPGPKGGETLTDHLDALRFGLPRRPEVVHRLDRDTSGWGAAAKAASSWRPTVRKARRGASPRAATASGTLPTSRQASAACLSQGGRRIASRGTPAIAAASAALREIRAAKGCVASTSRSTPFSVR